MDPTTAMLAMAGGSAVGSALAPWENPAESAMPYLEQVPQTISPYYNPYIGAGQQALGQYHGQSTNLTSNPGQFITNVGAGYQKSPGFDYQMEQALQAGTNAAAAGGYAGTPQHQQYAMQTASDITNQDYNQYLEHALRMYTLGLHGLGGVNEMGFQGTNQLTQALMDSLLNQANLEYEGQNAANQHEGGLTGLVSSLNPFSW